jgi:hypothetical protein
MSIIGSNILAGASGQAGGGGAAGYQIERSLRFNAPDSSFLSRTPGSAGNRKTWTWAGWVKIGGLTSYQNLLSNMNAGNSSGLYSGFHPNRTFFFDEYALTGGANFSSLALFRDPGAWYHLVIAYDTTQATASNRFKLYVNGVQATIAGSYPNQNLDGFWNRAVYSTIGKQGALASGNYFNGYLAEIHFIDGQALDPSSFGEFDTNGVWQPIDASGLTYGTNGFHLPFSDNSTAAALGTDTSGNSNTWTVNNLSVAAGAGNDSLVDSPTSYGTDTGAGGEVRGNYATLNPLTPGVTGLSNGNLDAASANAYPTIIPGSGSWYYEVNGTGYNWDGTSANWTPRAGSHNFGQRPYATTAPSGFKALTTANLPAGTITTSGTFTGNANADGPFVWLNGVPTAMTINGNAVTFATHADKLSNGFKVRTSSVSYNTAGSNTYSISTTGAKFKYARAQANP